MTSRRDFLKSTGIFVVGIGSAQFGSAQAAGPYPDVDFHQLDSWIVIREDNTATFYVGKTDLGQGTGTAFRQIMSDELDIGYDKTDVVMGATDRTPEVAASFGLSAFERGLLLLAACWEAGVEETGAVAQTDASADAVVALSAADSAATAPHSNGTAIWYSKRPASWRRSPCGRRPCPAGCPGAASSPASTSRPCARPHRSDPPARARPRRAVGRCPSPPR